MELWWDLEMEDDTIDNDADEVIDDGTSSNAAYDNDISTCKSIIA